MTQILSWNIQNGVGVDGVLSLNRIAEVIARMGNPDVICLQEISRGLQLQPESGTPDQIDELKSLFPNYEVIFGVAVDAGTSNEGTRWQFGNAILSKLSVVSVQHHILPRPTVSETKHMTRQTSEVVVSSKTGPLRIVNLHLEYHSLRQRMFQVGKLRELQLEALMEKQQPPKSDSSGPYQSVSRPVDSVYCGDFNMLYDSEEYTLLLSALADESHPFYDAWKLVHADKPHEFTCGIFDHKNWPQGPHCRDFFFVAGQCANQVDSFVVNTVTDASDHQPLMITLNQ